MVTTGPVTASP